MHFERGKQGINITLRAGSNMHAQRYLHLYICINVSTLFAVASLPGRLALSPFIVRTIEALPSHGHTAFLLNSTKSVPSGLSCLARCSTAAAALRGFPIIKQEGETRSQLFPSSPEKHTSAHLFQQAWPAAPSKRDEEAAGQRGGSQKTASLLIHRLASAPQQNRSTCAAKNSLHILHSLW